MEEIINFVGIITICFIILGVLCEILEDLGFIAGLFIISFFLFYVYKHYDFALQISIG